MKKRIISMVIIALATAHVKAGIYLTVKKDVFSESYISRVHIMPELVNGSLMVKECLYIRELTKDKKLNSLLYVQFYTDREACILDQEAYIIVGNNRVRVELTRRRRTNSSYYPIIDGEIILTKEDDTVLQNTASLRLAVGLLGKETIVKIIPEDLLRIQTAIKTMKTMK